MKVKVDDIDLFELSETQKKVIRDDIQDEIFDADMKRRLQWVIMHKYENCLKRMKEEWIPKLKENGLTSIPLDDDEFAELVCAQPDYKCRSQREAEEKLRLESEQSKV